MAAAKRKDVQVTQTVPGVSLDLTETEARTLAYVLNRIGGDTLQRRGDCDKIAFALASAGIRPLTGDLAHGSIYFH